MKPVRGLPYLWAGGLSRERRLALLATVVLFALIGSMALYQRLLPSAPPESAPGPAAESTDPAAAAPQAGDAAAGPAPTARQGEPESATEPVAAVRPESLAPPLPGSPRVMRAFGSLDESLGDYRLYSAVAYEATPGQPVAAAARGRVLALEEDPIDGTTLVLDHGGGMWSRYAGLEQASVAAGAVVEAGEVIGRVGHPGPLRADLGPHLAFSVWIDGDPVDPTEYLSE